MRLWERDRKQLRHLGNFEKRPGPNCEKHHVVDKCWEDVNGANWQRKYWQESYYVIFELQLDYFQLQSYCWHKSLFNAITTYRIAIILILRMDANYSSYDALYSNKPEFLLHLNVTHVVRRFLDFSWTYTYTSLITFMLNFLQSIIVSMRARRMKDFITITFCLLTVDVCLRRFCGCLNYILTVSLPANNIWRRIPCLLVGNE